MTDVKATVCFDEVEESTLVMFRVALSEPDHSARIQAIEQVRHNVTSQNLNALFTSHQYSSSVSSDDYPFLKWAAETASTRHEAMVSFMDVKARYEAGNERRLNVAEEIGFKIFSSVKDGAYRGVHTPGGIFEQVRDQARKESFFGGRDKTTHREVWNCYRGVVHLGMAISYLEENPDQHWHVLHLAEFFRDLLCTNFPKGASKPYVDPAEQIKFLYKSRFKGPRFRDRGLPFFDG